MGALNGGEVIGFEEKLNIVSELAFFCNNVYLLVTSVEDSLHTDGKNEPVII